MNPLAAWNESPPLEARYPVLACCGSSRFARELADARPFADVNSLEAKADAIWWSLAEQDWLEAFACHPRIGESAKHGSQQFAAWSAEEQSKAQSGGDAALSSIAARNREYEDRHGFLYIVCASGRSAGDLLALLEQRIGNTREAELREAAEQQRQITHIRFRKWLTP